ncbi:GBP5 protein, partial [Atractosteus spatula]|nr:GBP5 protein [Atractosteus spatula]
METPKLFIELKEDRIEINEEIAAYLERLRNKTEVIAIVGKQRTGKSFLLSWFFGTGRGFPVGHSRDACTKGIWLWCRPHPKHPDTELILLDTEGLDNPGATEKQDKQILLLAVLLSSSIIYNIPRCIDKSNIEDIFFVLQSVQEILVTEGSLDSEKIQNYLPHHFSVLLRDYQFEESEMDEHLGDVLQKLGPEIKSGVEAAFSKMEVHLLPTPAHKTKLRSLDTMMLKDLDEDFQNVLERMIKSIRDELSTPKIIAKDETICTPAAIVGLARSYITMLNSNRIVCLREAANDMMENLLNRAERMAKERFDCLTEMLNTKPMEKEDLEVLQTSAHSVGMFRFDQHTHFLLKKEKTQNRRKKLEQTMEEIKRDQEEKNLKRSEEKCKMEFHRLMNKYKLENCKGITAYSELLSKIKDLKEEYFSLPDMGPAREIVYEDLFRSDSYEKNSFQEVIRSLREKYSEKRRNIESFVKVLCEIADGMDFTHKGTTIGSVAGSAVAIAGSVLTIVGLALIPVTLGASAILTGVGAGVGLTGAATSVSSSIGKVLKNKKYEKELNDIKENLEAELKELNECIMSVCNILLIFKEHGLPEFLSTSSKFSVLATISITSIIDDIAGLGVKAMSRSLQIVGFVFAAINIIVEIVSIVKDSVELYEGCKTEKAETLREEAAKIMESLDMIENFVSEVQRMQESN